MMDNLSINAVEDVVATLSQRCCAAILLVEHGLEVKWQRINSALPLFATEWSKEHYHCK